MYKAIISAIVKCEVFLGYIYLKYHTYYCHHLGGNAFLWQLSKELRLLLHTFF